MKIPELTYPLRIDTLGKKLATGEELWVHCYQYDCNNRARLNIVTLAKRLGTDHPCSHRELTPRLYCSRCREAGRLGKDIGISCLPAGPHSCLDDRPLKSY